MTAQVPARIGLTEVELAAVAEMERIRAVEQLGVLDTPRSERFDRITRMARQLLGFEHVSIAFVDHDTHHTKSSLGAIPDEYSRFGSFCNVAIQKPGILVVPDATLDPHFKDSPGVVGGLRLRFYAGHSL
jgi:GAF domain-containing protein